MKSESVSLRENKIHGSVTFPCALYRADEGNYAPKEPFLCKHHWHDELEILYFVKGHYQVEINMEKYDIDRPCFCFVGSGEMHAISCESEFTERAIVFSLPMLFFAESDQIQEKYLEPLRSNKLSLPRFLFQDQAGYEQIATLYEDMTRRFWHNPAEDRGRPQTQYICSSLADQLRIKADLYGLLSVLVDLKLICASTDSANTQVELIKQSITYMREHYQNKIYIADLAAQANMSREYFCRFFKNVIGRSPMEYLNEMRIRQAAKLLCYSQTSVMDISLECGFPNLGNFMRTFKKQLGCTPLQYRKASRSDLS
ncbi:MAG: AraC family transcriptional regulator [Eubacteriales bacterium]|nr:AraC family transcriptional regulator [Eubacteriales bacterium]